jgi:hypothetical protein
LFGGKSRRIGKKEVIENLFHEIIAKNFPNLRRYGHPDLVSSKDSS